MSQITVNSQRQHVKGQLPPPRGRSRLRRTTIGERVRWVIETHMGMSQSDFAKKLHDRKGNKGISRQLINRWINQPEHPPGEDNLDEISEISGVSKVWLRYGEGDPFPADLGRPKIDPVVLHTALQEILLIAARALGADQSSPVAPRIEEDMIDVSPDIMAVLSPDAEFLRAGRQWTSSLGFERSEIEGKHWKDIVHPNDLQTSQIAFTISREQNAVVEFDSRAKNADGEYKTVRWRVTTENDRIVAAGRETSGPPTQGLQVITRGEKKP